VHCENQQEVDEMWEKHAERKARVVQAMLRMKKLDIAGLEAAYRGPHS
jgi:predicted 3-demethylubiquinone-9 3-methyltransferase (glyoxalase superfamily)